MSKIGFIGLGIMGTPMSKNLLKAGHQLVVHSLNPKSASRLVELGALRSESASDAAGNSDIIITMLPDGPEVEKVILGSGGVLEGVRSGSVVIDMSSVNPIVAQRVGAACAAKGVHFLDAPVSGGEPKAIDGTLAIMVGGELKVFREMEPVLKVMGSSVTLTGTVGAGNFTKLANQIIVACNIAAMGEAFVLATRAGLDPDIVFNAIKGGLAGSTVLNAKAPMVISRDFNPGFRIRLHQKDLRNALQAAESLKVGLPLTSAVQQMLMALMSQGNGDLDHAAIVTFLEEMSCVQIKSPKFAKSETIPASTVGKDCGC
jgi:2-hydroxy-3-oxopropionate reductase